MSEHGHDRLQPRAALGELAADGAPEAVRADGRFPAESTSPAAVHAAAQQPLGQQLAAHQEHVLHRTARAGIESRPSLLLAGQLDHRLQRLGGLWVQRDHALGVSFTDRDPQPRVPVGVSVEAVDGEAADLVAAGTAPPGDDQRGPRNPARPPGSSTAHTAEAQIRRSGTRTGSRPRAAAPAARSG
jgi:hypothetical protein